ncbi:MAG TPA: hypothetical protein VJO53_00555 [Candidatus Acidoferrales bacterium]|nr:hypothetical protein [Candidatus Acidoferrales bacterium]
MEPGENVEREERSRFPAAFAVGVIVMLFVAAGLIVLARATRSHRPGAAEKLPFGRAEQAYAQRIHFTDLELSESTNLLNQPFTYVTGTMSNDGVRTVRGLEVTVEFNDQFKQVVLRDSRRLIGSTAQPLTAGQMREFQITLLEHVPSEWNQQYPVIRVTGLILQ